MGMNAAEELKLTCKFEWEIFFATPGSRDWSFEELGLWQDQNLSSVYHVMNNGWLDNNPKGLHIYGPHE
jgi:hypothetical protein